MQLCFLIVLALHLPGTDPAQPAEKPKIPIGGSDFKQYYTTSKLIIDGHNPYDHDRAREIQHAMGAQGPPQVPYGPPICLLPFIPLGWLSFQDAILGQFIINITFMMISGFLWGMMLFPSKPMMPLIGAVSVLAWIPTLLLFGLGHVTSWTVLGFSLWCFCMHQKRCLSAGIALALCLIKPHLALGPIVYALIVSLSQRQWKTILAFAGTVLLAVAATFIIRPTIWNEYLASLPQSNPTQWYNATLDGWGRLQLDFWGMEREAQTLGIDPAKVRQSEPPADIKARYGNHFRYVSWGIGLVILAVILYWAARREHTSLQAALVSALCICATPYAFSYDYVLLVPVFIFALGTAIFRTHPWWWITLVGWLALDVFYLFAKMRMLHESNFFPIPWSALAITLLILPVKNFPSPKVPSPLRGEG